MPFSSHGDMLRNITDAAEAGMVLFGGDERVVLWNAWMANASGIPAETALGHTLGQLFPNLTRSRIELAVHQAISTGMSAMLSSSLNKKQFPLMREGRLPGKTETMRQIVVVKPVTTDGQRYCLVQVFDVTDAAGREAMLRQQARTMEALAENYRLSEMHMRAIVDTSADAILTFDKDGTVGTFNPGAESVFGHHGDDIVGKSVTLLVPDLASPDGTLRAAEFAGTRREVQGLRRNGTAFPLELSVSAMEAGGERMFVAIGHDITARLQAEAEIRNQKDWLTTLINALPDLVCFRDGKGRWLVANQICLDVAGLAGVNYQGRAGTVLAEMSTSQGGETLLNDAEIDERAWQERKPVAYEKAIHGIEGAAKVFDVLKIPLFHADGSRRGLVMVGRDITERKLAAARIHHLAHHDSLTGLANRVLFQERLRLALAQARRTGTKLALLYLDLDKFKDVNDTLGHQVGDLLLKAVAKRLLRCVRETDTVARLGGDEFAVILTNLTEPPGASLVAEAIVATLAEPFGLGDHEVRSSTSVGISIFPDDAVEPEHLLRNADMAMFRSKAESRGSYRFYVAAMDAEVQARKMVERDLRTALGTEQLELHYQPLVDLGSRTIVGCEALLRWRHPTRGWVSPNECIPVAERSDIISPLGRWILHQACQQGQAWAEEGLPPVTISVNLSPAQFKHSQNLVSMIAEVLEQTGMPPGLLQLEITEGIAMQNIEETIDVLRQLRSTGVRIAIDDFGTGYSSLNYLKRFPVDKLKIDRSFVADIGQHPDNAAVIEAIVTLGHSLGTRVNVEGVESAEQLEFALTRNVDEAQGYYFSPPVPAAEFARLLRQPMPWVT